MWCSTKELVNYVKMEYVAKGKTAKGIGFLLKVLESNSPHKGELSFFKGKATNLSREERLDTISDKSIIYRNDYGFVKFLDEFEEKERFYIFVKKKKRY